MEFERNTLTGMVTLIPVPVTLFVFGSSLDLLDITGAVLAAVYVPTATDPEGNYIEIVPATEPIPF